MKTLNIQVDTKNCHMVKDRHNVLPINHNNDFLSSCEIKIEAIGTIYFIWKHISHKSYFIWNLIHDFIQKQNISHEIIFKRKMISNTKTIDSCQTKIEINIRLLHQPKTWFQMKTKTIFFTPQIFHVERAWFYTRNKKDFIWNGRNKK